MIADSRNDELKGDGTDYIATTSIVTARRPPPSQSMTCDGTREKAYDSAGARSYIVIGAEAHVNICERGRIVAALTKQLLCYRGQLVTYMPRDSNSVTTSDDDIIHRWRKFSLCLILGEPYLDNYWSIPSLMCESADQI